jgi:hypothetical protein
MQNQTQFRHDKRFYNATKRARSRVQRPSARTAGMRRVLMCAAAYRVDVRFAAILPTNCVKTQTACHAYQRASLVLLLHSLIAASYMRRQTQFLHGKHSCNAITSALGHAQSPSARTAGKRPAMFCAAACRVDVRFAAIRPSNCVKTQTVFRVSQRASPVLQLFFLCAALCMRPQTQFRHGRHFYNATASASGHAQSPNAHTAGLLSATMSAAQINKGVRFAAIHHDSFVTTQTAFRVCLKALLVQQLCL